MKKLLIMAAVLALAWYFGKPLLQKTAASASGSAYEEVAKARVAGVLEGTKRGGAGASTDVQIAICWWSIGKPRGCETELYRSSDLFDVWRREKGIEGGMKSYTVDDAIVTQTDRPRTAIVRATVDGRRLEMIVPEGEKIRWKS
jgi:hypothetical protein